MDNFIILMPLLWIVVIGAAAYLLIIIVNFLVGFVSALREDLQNLKKL